MPFFDKIVSRECLNTDLRKVKVITDMPPLKSKKKKNLQAYLGILNYLNNSSPTTEVYEPLRWLISVKTEWTLYGSYQKLFAKQRHSLKMHT